MINVTFCYESEYNCKISSAATPRATPIFTFAITIFCLFLCKKCFNKLLENVLTQLPLLGHKKGMRYGFAGGGPERAELARMLAEANSHSLFAGGGQSPIFFYHTKRLLLQFAAS